MDLYLYSFITVKNINTKKNSFLTLKYETPRIKSNQFKCILNLNVFIILKGKKKANFVQPASLI